MEKYIKKEKFLQKKLELWKEYLEHKINWKEFREKSDELEQKRQEYYK